MSLSGPGLVTVESLHSVRLVVRPHTLPPRVDRTLPTETGLLAGLVLVSSIGGYQRTVTSQVVDEDRLTEHDSHFAGDLAPTGPEVGQDVEVNKQSLLTSLSEVWGWKTLIKLKPVYSVLLAILS